MKFQTLSNIDKKLIRTRKTSQKKAKKKSSRYTGLTSRQVKKKDCKLKNKRTKRYASCEIKKKRYQKMASQHQQYLCKSLFDTKIDELGEEKLKLQQEQEEKEYQQALKIAAEQDEIYSLEDLREKCIQELCYEKQTLNTKITRVKEDLKVAFQDEKEVERMLEEHKQNQLLHKNANYRRRCRQLYPCRKCRQGKLSCKLERKRNETSLKYKEKEVQEKITTLMHEQNRIFATYDEVDKDIDAVRFGTYDGLRHIRELRMQYGIDDDQYSDYGSWDDGYDSEGW